jgi:hypothetical protein
VALSLSYQGWQPTDHALKYKNTIALSTEFRLKHPRFSNSQLANIQLIVSFIKNNLKIIVKMFGG